MCVTENSLGPIDGILTGEVLRPFDGIDVGKRAVGGVAVGKPLGEPFGASVGSNAGLMDAKPVG